MIKYCQHDYPEGLEGGCPSCERDYFKQRLGEFEEFIRLIATPKRPDGTYNYCREALEKKAKELLK